MTAAAKRTLASPPARLRWRHGTARTRHGGHITENPQGHAPHGRVKRSRWRLPLCSVRGPAGKRRGFTPPSSAPDFCQGIRHAADFSPGFPDHLPQNTTIKPATWRFARYTPRIFCHPATDTAYCIAHRIKNSPDFVFGQPFTGIWERHLRSVRRKYQQRLPLTARQNISAPVPVSF